MRKTQFAAIALLLGASCSTPAEAPPPEPKVAEAAEALPAKVRTTPEVRYYVISDA